MKKTLLIGLSLISPACTDYDCKEYQVEKVYDCVGTKFNPTCAISTTWKERKNIDLLVKPGDYIYNITGWNLMNPSVNIWKLGTCKSDNRR